MTREDAYRLLAVRPPFTGRQLKSCFRAAALLAHPDRGGNEEQFVVVKEAYDLLEGDAGEDQVYDPVARTVDGMFLESLGRGLKVSGKKCGTCAGRGYEEGHDYRWCSYCYGGAIPGCRACGSTGGRSAKKYWVCSACRGAGEVASFNPLMVKNSIMTNQKQPKKLKQKKEWWNK